MEFITAHAHGTHMHLQVSSWVPEIPRLTNLEFKHSQSRLLPLVLCSWNSLILITLQGHWLTISAESGTKNLVLFPPANVSVGEFSEMTFRSKMQSMVEIHLNLP